MDPERAVDELFSMVQLLASNVASKALREAHSSYTVPELIAETDRWIETAQQVHRLSEKARTYAPLDITTDACSRDVSGLGEAPCRCLRPRGHTGIHECSHNLGRFTR